MQVARNFRDKVDIAYDRRVSSWRRRIEWPTIDTNIYHLLDQDNSVSPHASSGAKAVIDEEISKCDTCRNLIFDLL
jgi:hypothetical protein